MRTHQNSRVTLAPGSLFWEGGSIFWASRRRGANAFGKFPMGEYFFGEKMIRGVNILCEFPGNVTNYLKYKFFLRAIVMLSMSWTDRNRVKLIITT